MVFPDPIFHLYGGFGSVEMMRTTPTVAVQGEVNNVSGPRPGDRSCMIVYRLASPLSRRVGGNRTMYRIRGIHDFQSPSNKRYDSHPMGMFIYTAYLVTQPTFSGLMGISKVSPTHKCKTLDA